MSDSADKQETLEDLRIRIASLEDERSKRLKGELAVAAAKKRVDDELQRMKAIQAFVSQALKIRNANEMTEAALETIVEAFECETAAHLLFSEKDQAFRVVQSFDDEIPEEELPYPKKLLEQQKDMLLEEAPELAKGLGLSNGIICTYSNSNSEVVGAIVGGNTSQGEGIYAPMEEFHKSSFSVLVNETASLRENLLLNQRIQAYVEELEEHKDLLEQRVEERTLELHKEQVKLASTLDTVQQSINYAARIQRSTLSAPTIFEHTFSDYFIFWEPRDIVGGDMYWAAPWGEGVLLILGDCTGHGVPGAFVTLLASGAIERAKLNTPEGDVGSLLNRVHEQLQISLGQNVETGEADDGIELGACYIEKDQTRLTYSGARFELFVVENGEVEIIKGSKKGMGYRNIPTDQLYPSLTIDSLTGKTFYLTTDGYIDQVGHERRRMFGKKRFSKLLLELQEQPMDEQKSKLYEALIDYQGPEVRRDDVSLIGFKFG